MSDSKDTSTAVTRSAPVATGVLIIGSGFGGICAAIRLQKSGRSDFLILERRAFMGGTWAQNHYPGAAVDVQSPLYSLSGEPYDWTQMFAEQSELAEYTHHIIEKHQLERRCITDANVSEARWIELEKQWRVSLADGRCFCASVLINASGPLSQPVTPYFDGAETFEGRSMHTNDWDDSYSLANKKVAVIGSGASAAQLIPAIVSKVSDLHVFQRSPHWVLPRPDHKFSAWQRRLLRIGPIYQLLRKAIYWALETRVIGLKYSRFALDQIAKRQALRHIKRQVPDATLRDRVTPDFVIGCKRVILSNNYYPALTHDKVSVHSKDDGITRITTTGIETTQGEQIPLDLIVYATGYDATDGVISYPVIGRDDRHLREFWSDFPRAYLGTSVPGFPNLFLITGPNTGIGHTSAIFVIEAQMNYVMDTLKNLEERGGKQVEVTAQAEAQYTQKIHQEMDKTVWSWGGCNSWYKSKSGKVIAMFPGFSFSFQRLAKRFNPTDHTIE